MLHTGELVPHFTVRTIDGETVEYAAIWQHRNIVLVSLPPHDSSPGRRWADEIAARRAELDRDDAAGIVTHDAVPGVPSPAALVADRWGEIAFIAGADEPADLPSIDELMQWLHYVQIRCAECEGEAT